MDTIRRWYAQQGALGGCLLAGLLALSACEGPPGADGEDGSPGPQGSPGEDGSDGQDGTDGQDGQDGQDGTDGQDGQDGTDGQDGQDGTDGQDGQDGTSGQDGQDLTAEPEALNLSFSAVETAGHPVATFSVTDQDGAPFTRLSQALVDSRAIRMSIVKLVPGENGDSSHWQSYVNTLASTANSTAGPNGVPALGSAVQATNDSGGTLANLGGGVYTYTFGVDLTAVTSPVAVTYDEDLLHRVAMQLEYPLDSGEEIILNPTFDWVPSGAAAPATRDIATTASCNGCHDPLALHGGGRQEVGYCVTCHNPGTTDPNSGNNLDLTVMVHKIHMGHSLPSVEAGGEYTIYGFRDAEHNYSHVGYPQSQANCRTCHSIDNPETPDGDAWNTQPTMQACGACHDNVNFATGEGHGPEDVGGVRTDNSRCNVCHESANIIEYHTTNLVTEHNPELPAGARDIRYNIASVSVTEGGQPVVEFSITSDGQPLDVSALPTDLTSAGRYPGFLLAWAMPQDGREDPADYNNGGQDSAQPLSIGLNTILDGSQGTLTGSGPTYTATFNQAYPQGAKLRAVAIQSYFRQTLAEGTIDLHTPSVVAGVTGDDQRRMVVDSNSCLSCHEAIEGHGGSRVNNVQVCVTCHNTNLSSSGTVLNLENPESSNNFKDMIHGIHGASQRTYPLDFVRNRNGGSRYTFITESQLDEYPDGIVVTYPGNLSNCTTCHLPGTYGAPLSQDTLPSTHVTTDGVNASTADVSAARATVPNDTDLVVSPQTASCMSCHNSDAAQAHFEQNGGVVFWSRAMAFEEDPYETCEICHGAGRTADVDLVHGL